MNLKEVTIEDLINEIKSRHAYDEGKSIILMSFKSGVTECFMSGVHDELWEMASNATLHLDDAISDHPKLVTTRKVIDGIDYMSDEALFQP